MKRKEFLQQIVEYYPNLSFFAMKLTKDREDCNDLVQDTMEKAIVGFDKKMYQGGNLQVWLFTIMKNQFINIIRKRANRHHTQLKEAGFKSYMEDIDRKLYLDEVLEKINTYDLAKKNIILFYMKGYKYREIAEMMEIKIGTVKSIIHHTRKKLTG